MAQQDIIFLYIKSDNLIKVENLVKKSFGDDEVIDDATIKMTLYEGGQIAIAANAVSEGVPVLIMPGDAVNKGGGEVGITIKGNPFLAGDKITIAGTDSYDGTKEVNSVNVSAAIAEVQTLHPSAVATAGTFTLSYKGQTTSALAHNASTSAVQTALEALSTVEPGDIVVSGNPLSVGDMVFTFDTDIQDAPMIEIVNNLTGPTTCTITQTVQGKPAGATSEIVFDSEYIAETFAGDWTETIQKTVRGAADRGGGLVGIPVLNHRLKTGDYVRIWGTKNYNGVFQISSVTTSEIRITATYAAEDFTGAEYLYRAVPNAVNIAFTATGTGGNYSGVLPDTAEMTPDATYYLEIEAEKGDSNLLIRHTCKAVFFPKRELY